MSVNKKLIETYFATPDRSKVGELLTDAVEWVEWADGVPATGVRQRGKMAYLANSGDDEHHTNISRWVEEGNTVVAEGTTRVTKRDGRVFHVQFVDIFELESGKIMRKTSYGALLKDPS